MKIEFYFNHLELKMSSLKQDLSNNQEINQSFYETKANMAMRKKNKNDVFSTGDEWSLVQ